MGTRQLDAHVTGEWKAERLRLAHHAAAALIALFDHEVHLAGWMTTALEGLANIQKDPDWQPYVSDDEYDEAMADSERQRLIDWHTKHGLEARVFTSVGEARAALEDAEKHGWVTIDQTMPDGHVQQFTRYVVGYDGNRGIYVAPHPDAGPDEWTLYRWDDKTIEIAQAGPPA